MFIGTEWKEKGTLRRLYNILAFVPALVGLAIGWKRNQKREHGWSEKLGCFRRSALGVGIESLCPLPSKRGTGSQPTQRE